MTNPSRLVFTHTAMDRRSPGTGRASARRSTLTAAPWETPRASLGSWRYVCSRGPCMQGLGGASWMRTASTHHTPTHPPWAARDCAQAGGQRLVQSVCYLDTLAPGRGGGTRFAHPALKGLTVQVLLARGRSVWRMAGQLAGWMDGCQHSTHLLTCSCPSHMCAAAPGRLPALLPSLCRRPPGRPHGSRRPARAGGREVDHKRAPALLAGGDAAAVMASAARPDLAAVRFRWRFLSQKVFVPRRTHMPHRLGCANGPCQRQ